MFSLELECQNIGCLYKYPHLKQKQKYLRRRIENLDTLGPMETSDLSHIVEGKISLTPMETIFIILGELEYLEGLVKLVKKKKDVETT
jgi:hypothetical protein